jgi:hypothetical protein
MEAADRGAKVDVDDETEEDGLLVVLWFWRVNASDNATRRTLRAAFKLLLIVETLPVLALLFPLSNIDLHAEAE